MRKLTRTYWSNAPGTPLDVNREFYDELAQQTDKRKLVDKFILPIRDGRAWPVRAGQLCRILVLEGPQAGDLNVWNLHNPAERMWTARTKQVLRAHVSTYDRLWSCLPYLRPMFTITNDTIQYGVDEDGAGCHDILGTRCDPYMNKIFTGEDFDYTCHSNLTRAVAPYHLTEADVHDVVNLFQVTGFLEDDRMGRKPSRGKPGDFFEFFAEIDLLCALSTCPMGDLSVNAWGPDAADPLSTCRPLGVEVYETDPELLKGWKSPETANYKGTHGMGLK